MRPEPTAAASRGEGAGRAWSVVTGAAAAAGTSEVLAAPASSSGAFWAKADVLGQGVPVADGVAYDSVADQRSCRAH